MPVAAQNTPFGRGTGGRAGDQVAAHIGGSSRVSYLLNDYAL
jgi:hypothetical protein